MFKEVITLLVVENERSRSGSAKEKIISEREVFAEERTVGFTQMVELQTIGLKVTKTFRVADYYDYEGEEYLVHNDKRYNVLRISQKNEDNSIDLVVGTIVNKGGEDYGNS